MPDWYTLLLLGLGVYRICRLVGYDDLTIPLRHRITGMGDEEHSQWAYVVDTAKDHDRSAWNLSVGDFFDWGLTEVPPLVGRTLVGPTDKPYEVGFRPPVTERRYYLSKMLRCPWCLGFWLAAAAWTAYEVAPRGTLVVMSLLAVSAIPGLVTKNLDKGS